jgi:hypothetical protein
MLADAQERQFKLREALKTRIQRRNTMADKREMNMPESHECNKKWVF